MKLIKNNANFYIDKINKGEHFSLTRWGDGEWLCASGYNGMNCDKHQYFPELREGLNKALSEDKNYYKAIWDVNHGQIKSVLNIILPHLEKINPNIEWVDAIIWENLAIDNNLNELIEALENKTFIMVSNSNNRNVPIKYTDYIETPSVNCFLNKDIIKSKMIDAVEKYGDVVFGLSASMATNVIVDELYDIIGDKASMIDFGSIWDPFSGRITRSYHREYKTHKL